MKSRKALRLLVPGFVALLVFATAGMAQAGDHVDPHTYPRAVSISVSHNTDGSYTFSGVVSVIDDNFGSFTPAECVGSKTVTLSSSSGGSSTATTTDGGAWSITIHVTSNPSFHASVISGDSGNLTHPHFHFCSGATSAYIKKTGGPGSPFTAAAQTRFTFGALIGLAA